MAKANGNVYRSYLFKEQDPIVDALRDAISETKRSYTDISRESGVCANTIGNWLNNETKRPQFATVSAVARALGKKGLRWGRNSGKPYFTDV